MDLIKETPPSFKYLPNTHSVQPTTATKNRKPIGDGPHFRKPPQLQVSPTHIMLNTYITLQGSNALTLTGLRQYDPLLIQVIRVVYSLGREL